MNLVFKVHGQKMEVTSIIGTSFNIGCVFFFFFVFFFQAEDGIRDTEL